MDFNIEIEEKWPLHNAVWENNVERLEQILNFPAGTSATQMKSVMEKEDVRGRTALLLAVRLKRKEMVEKLLKRGSDANALGKDFWSVLDEAICTGDREFIEMCSKYSAYQISLSKDTTLCHFLDRLAKTNDFYVEMKWDFTSWIPFISKLCPNDVHYVYKRGRHIRLDTTLADFNSADWKRGRTSYIFKPDQFSSKYVFLVIDHEARRVRRVFTEESMTNFQIISTQDEAFLEKFKPSIEKIDSLLNSTVRTLHIDLEKVDFERKLYGIYGMRQTKDEDVNGYLCKAFCTSNLNVLTKSRTEHLEHDVKNNLQETEDEKHGALPALFSSIMSTKTKVNPVQDSSHPIGKREYFLPTNSQQLQQDVGRPQELTVLTRTFSATLWLCNDYPLSLVDQILPLIDVMATTNAHFMRLKDFLTLRLPTGFPVKIEIPIFHLVNAVISFDNAHAEKRPVQGVTFLSDDDGAKFCALDDELFDIPPGYIIDDVSDSESAWNANVDVDYSLLQNADQNDPEFARALQESLVTSGSSVDADLALALALSQITDNENQQQRMDQEEEQQLQEALRESLKFT